MSRLENAVTRDYLIQIEKQLVNTFVDSYNMEPKLIIFGYITGLAGNKKLHELAEIVTKSAKSEYEQYKNPVK